LAVERWLDAIPLTGQHVSLAIPHPATLSKSPRNTPPQHFLYVLLQFEVIFMDGLNEK
jgi:hypothetical protein